MAAFVKSVERFTTAFPASTQLQTNTINLTKGQDETKCVPFYTKRLTGSSGDTRPDNAVSVEMIDNGGTPAARVRRQCTRIGPNSAVVEVTIVEFESTVTVQQGNTSLTDLTATATITSVNQGNAFVTFTQHSLTDSAVDDWDDTLIQARFNSNTQIQFDRRAAGDPDWEVYWYVVESNGTDFQTEYVEYSWASGETGPTNRTLSNSVTLANSFLICSYESAEISDDMRDATVNFALTGTTTLTFYRNHGGSPSGTGTMGVWVVRSDSNGCTVQRLATDVDGQTTTNQTITTVDLAATAIIPSQNVGLGEWPINSDTGGNDIHDLQTTIVPTTSTNVALTRQALTTVQGSNNFIRYEVVYFSIAGAGPPDQSVAVGIASETDSALAVTPVAGAVSVAVGQADETDTAFTVTPEIGGAPQIVVVGQADETDSVEPVTPIPGTVSVSVGLAEETDSAQAVTPLPGAVAVDIGIASEIDLAAPVFPVVEGGPQTVLVLNVTETDQAFTVTPRIGPEEGPIKGGLPPVRKRKRRRYILPDGRSFDDPNRALFELRELLTRQPVPGEDQTAGADRGAERPESAQGPAQEAAAPAPLSAKLMSEVVADLPELIQARPLTADSIDSQLVSVLLQRIDDEEAAMLLLDG